MRFLTKVALLSVVLAFVAGFAVPSPVAQAGETGMITCINKTATPLNFSVGGDEETCRATQGRVCEIRYEVGKHRLYAEDDDGLVRARKTIDLTSTGVTWTVNKFD